MQLDELRKEIDRIDAELLEKLEERLNIVVKIGKNKKENGLQVVDPEREWKKLEVVENGSIPEFAEYNLDVFEAIMDASKELQQRIVDGEVLECDADEVGDSHDTDDADEAGANHDADA